MFEFSLGPIPWLYMAEIMTDKGLTLAVVLNWIWTLTIAIITPFLVSGPFFIVLGGLCAVVSQFYVLIIIEWIFLSLCPKGNKRTF
jgi:hypothetical protein